MHPPPRPDRDSAMTNTALAFLAVYMAGSLVILGYTKLRTKPSALYPSEESAMKVSDVYGSKYLAAKDIAGQSIDTEVIGADTELVTGGDREAKNRVVLQCDGIRKPIVVNATNAGELSKAWGDELAGWVGRKLTVTTRAVQFGGKLVDGIALVPHKGKPAKQ